ncbi:hypothetical protein GQ43DRAFT_443827 [Delitschia confertaspora ATCC 74209]|uniref:Uncharacterized protein n=1 Tax=Delitschia confertaspora ATCC 74209 TaxID=1513339 RepID=A0A9P4MP62_9PLEO|nr:hypothetical protein GQ43DRAFT_443827 [Delitschia confertaspora ATCC 74209]
MPAGTLKPLLPKPSPGNQIPEALGTSVPQSSPATDPPISVPIEKATLAPCNQIAWPSQVAQSTMWLLPPHSDQSAAITQLLRTEIQSHNITREMLHTTEQRRLEAVQNYHKIWAENQAWATAYNSLTAALHRCSEEFARVTAENEAMRTRMNASGSEIVSTPHLLLDPIAPKNRQIQVLRKRLSQLSNGKAEVPPHVDPDELWLQGNGLESSVYYSSEV